MPTTQTCKLNAPRMPCPSCPWRKDATAQDIPNFDLDLAERLAATCPDEQGMGPDFGASLFACHQSREGRDRPCAGWLAKVGHCHPVVRLAVRNGDLDPSTLAPKPEWPALHDSYGEVLRKLRANVQAE